MPAHSAKNAMVLLMANARTKAVAVKKPVRKSQSKKAVAFEKAWGKKLKAMVEFGEYTNDDEKYEAFRRCCSLLTLFKFDQDEQHPPLENFRRYMRLAKGCGVNYNKYVRHMANKDFYRCGGTPAGNGLSTVAEHWCGAADMLKRKEGPNGVGSQCLDCDAQNHVVRRAPSNKTTLQHFSRLVSSMHLSQDICEFKDGQALVDFWIDLIVNNKINCVFGDHIFVALCTNGLFNSMSVERINELLGYLLTNVRPIPRCLNSGKAQFTDDVANLIASKALEPTTNAAQVIHMLMTPSSTGPRVFMNKAISSTKYSTKRRQAKGRSLADSEMTEAIYLRLVKKQGGRCALTGAKLLFSTHDRGDPRRALQASIDRLDDSVTYIEPNLRLVCQCFNSSCNGGQRSKQATEAARALSRQLTTLPASYMRQSMWAGLGADAQAAKWAIVDANVADAIEQYSKC